MRTSRIFDGIDPAEADEMLRCFAAVTRRYKAGAAILNYSNALTHVCVLLKGTAQISSLDAEGNLNIIETLDPDGVFGEVFSLPTASRMYTVAATSPCEVLFIPYERVVRRCERMCAHHDRFINNLFMLSAQKAQMLSKRIAILSQKTLRQKLLVYLDYMSLERETNAFTLPMTLSRLAEYLSVDRSAMMRELSRMRDDGLIYSSGRHFELLTEHDLSKK